MKLSKKFFPIFQKGKNNTGESFKTIDDLHAYDRKKKRHKEFWRIRL